MFAHERVHCSIVQVAAWRDGTAEVVSRLRTAGWELPEFGHAWFAPQRLALSVVPQRWLLIDEKPDSTLLGDCTAAVGESAAVVELTAARSAWRVTGDAARTALAAGCRLDLDPAVFPPGTAAATLIAQVHSVVVAHPECLLLLCSSSVAGHFGDWLQHVAPATHAAKA